MQLGAAGVTFFFVLSGFVIQWSYRSDRPVLWFYRRRILKIYPTHLVAAAMFVVVAAVPVSRIVLWLPNALLVHTWVPKWTTVGGLNVPAWSLCAEMLFYLSFPLAMPLVRRINGPALWWAMGGLVVLILAMHTGFFLLAEGPKGIANIFVPRLLPGDVSPHSEIHASPQWFAQNDIPVSPSYWLSYTFPLSRLPEFYVGVCTARLVSQGRWPNVRLATALAALAVAYGATWLVPINFKMSALLVGPMAAVIATLAARDLAGISGLNSTPPLVWLGKVSFAFYMIQFPVMVLITRVFIGGHQYGFFGWLAWASAIFGVSVILAAAIYRWVDTPIMRRFGRPKGSARLRLPAAAEVHPGCAESDRSLDHAAAVQRG
ncbi:acyltransferase [Skermania sp. ID1734]|uniref:acyltransferase family protein n=1 Tax=Skermania sp. ID1734 TaxID=2597516 RepID=UPI002104922E|nr:acyltransferase [Skermania sp. ID1734]